MSFIINEKEKDLAALTNNLTQFHKPYPGLKNLTNEIDNLKKKQIFDNKFGHYKTAHERDFPGYDSNLYADAYRPGESGTEKSIRPPAKSNWDTTAATNYCWKTCEPTEPIRSGTASGNRRNNPHPHESFMNWKLNKNKVIADTKNLEIKDEPTLNKILRDQLTSTYDNDYLDNRDDIKKIRFEAEKELYDWKNPDKVRNVGSNTEESEKIKWDNQVERDFNTKQYLSSNTVTYRQPVHHRHLDDNTTRYGCNRNKMSAAVGAVPTVINKHIQDNRHGNKTSYQEQFAKSTRKY